MVTPAASSILVPSGPPHHYLDTPSMGVPPWSAVDAIHAAVMAWAEGRGDFAMWERAMESCRGLFAEIVQVPATEVGLLPSVVPAFSAAAATIARGSGTVVAHRKEFRSLLLPVLAQVPESLIRWVDGPYLSDTFISAMDQDTDAVVVSAVSSHDGGRPSLTRLRQACEGAGARLVVDGTQATGIVVPDVPLQSLALFAAAGYKGLRGPRGVAYAVAEQSTVSGFASTSAYGVADSDLRGGYGPPLIPKPGAQGLDQSPSWFGWVGAEPALAELAAESSILREERVVGLSARAREHVVGLGAEPQPTDLPSPIVTFASPDAEALVKRLAGAGIRATSRLGRVRVGFHVYNDDRDVDELCNVLDDEKDLVRP